MSCWCLQKTLVIKMYRFFSSEKSNMLNRNFKRMKPFLSSMFFWHSFFLLLSVLLDFSIHESCDPSSINVFFLLISAERPVVRLSAFRCAGGDSGGNSDVWVDTFHLVYRQNFSAAVF